MGYFVSYQKETRHGSLVDMILINFGHVRVVKKFASQPPSSGLTNPFRGLSQVPVLAILQQTFVYLRPDIKQIAKAHQAQVSHKHI